MPFRVPPHVRQQLFSTSSRSRTALPSQFHSYNPTTPQFPLNTGSVPKLGRIGRWYLPTMALIAVGMIYLPINSLLPTSASPPASTGRRTVTLNTANRQIGFAIANALEEHNNKQNREMTQEERNMMLLEAYGERNSLEDMERALSGHGVMKGKGGQSERHRVLTEAYGERKSLKDVERALEVYEVQ